MSTGRIGALLVVTSVLIVSACSTADPPPTVSVSVTSGNVTSTTPTSMPPASPSTSNVETIEVSRADAREALDDAIDALVRLDLVSIRKRYDQGSWDFPLPTLTTVNWDPDTGAYHAKTRADDPSGDATLEQLLIDDHYYARMALIARPAPKWSDITDTIEPEQKDPAEIWLYDLANFEALGARESGATATINGKLPTDVALELLGMDFSGSLPQDLYSGTTQATVIIEGGLPSSLSFTGADIKLAGTDMPQEILDRLEAAAYSIRYAEGDPAKTPQSPRADGVRRFSAFS